MNATARERDAVQPMGPVILVRPKAAGGLLAHMRHEARILAKAGVGVIDAGDPAYSLASREFPSHITTVPLIISEGPNLLHAVRAAFRLRSIVREAQSTAPHTAPILHAHGMRAGAIAAAAMLGTNNAQILTLHNEPPRSGIKGLIGKVLFVAACRGARSVLAVSPDLERAAKRAGARAVERATIPAPVPRECTSTVQQSRGGPLQILCVARLAPQKRLTDLIDALAIINRSPHAAAIRTRVAGDGPLLESLQERAQAAGVAIEFLGHRADVTELMNDADLIVQPSDWEGQPVALQEALLLGKPIVATDVGGTRWVTSTAARLVPARSPHALAEAILDIASSPSRQEILRDMGEASARRGRELPTETDLRQQLSEILGLPLESANGKKDTQ